MAEIPVTKAKKKWTRQFRKDTLRGKALNPNLSEAARYQKQLDILIDRMAKDVRKQLSGLFKDDAAREYFTEDASLSSQARIVTNALMRKYNELFEELSKPIADRVVEGANKSSAVAMHKSLESMSGGLSIDTKLISPYMKEILKASITENVALIKSISEKYLNSVQQAVMRSITTGRGMQDLIPFLDKEKGITHRRAKMIAYDQTRKAFNALNRGRMEKLGIKKFEWLHSGGSREPRKLHQELSGQIFSLDDLPVIDKTTGERGFPGTLVNCRCRALPVVTFED